MPDPAAVSIKVWHQAFRRAKSQVCVVATMTPSAHAGNQQLDVMHTPLSSRVHKPEQRILCSAYYAAELPPDTLLLAMMLYTQLDHDLKGFLTELQQACQEAKDDENSIPQHQEASSSSNGSEEQLQR